MTSLLQPRQPFAVLDDTRLQALGSIKNRQNNVLKLDSLAKAPSSAPAKRRLTSELFDDLDSENFDPSILNTPIKRYKNLDGTPSKVSRFILTNAVSKSTTASPTSLNPPVKRNALSMSLPSTTTVTTTPIAHSRGSPKHKRIGLLSNKRRRQSTPFRRINPPSGSTSALPFSIDAALSGTVSSYEPSPAAATATAAAAASVSSEPFIITAEKPMPKSWFFEIHEDTPDQEVGNLLQHSASILDISSDDDSVTAALKDAMERGKENIPPPEYTGTARNPRSRQTTHKGIASVQKAEKYALAGGPDAMLEDRAALREMDVAAFFPDGLDNESVEVVDDNKSSKQSTPSKPTSIKATEESPAEVFVRADTEETEEKA